MSDPINYVESLENRPQKYRMYVREFLNLPHHHSSAHIIAEVTDTSDEFHPDGKENLDIGSCSLTIGDCSRQIHLSLGMWHQEERQNTRHKIDFLVNTLIEFREKVFAEMDLADAREEKRKTKRGQEDAEYRSRLRSGYKAPSGELTVFNGVPGEWIRAGEIVNCPPEIPPCERVFVPTFNQS